MHIIQYDMQQRVPYDNSTSGYYYWTNTFFYDLDNPPTQNPSDTWLRLGNHLCLLPMVQSAGNVMTSPPGSGIVVGGGPGAHDPGTAPFGPSAPIANIVRVNLYSEGRIVGYKRWRMPIPVDHIVDGYLSDELHGYLQANLGYYWWRALLTTRDGVPIDTVTVDPRVRLWGIRVGTKRRSRSVLIYT